MKVGQKVMCVNDSVKEGQEAFVAKAYRNWIKKGKLYTIRSIHDNQDIVTGILLEEVVNGAIYIHLIDDWAEPMFSPTRFRELEQVDDLAIAEEIEEELLINI